MTSASNDIGAGAANDAQPASDSRASDGAASNGAYPSVGAQLAAARNAKRLSLEEVADAIRIRRDYLEAIEVMDPRALPHGPYAAGFVRTYADFLDLDGDAAAARFRAEMSPRRSLRQPEAPKVKVERKLNKRALAVVCVMGAVALFAWYGLQPRAAVDADGVPPVPEALEAWVRAEPGADGARLLAELEAAEGSTIALTARVPVRIEVTGPGGELLYANVLRMDATYEVPQRAGLTISARNAGAVEVFRDGESMGRMGRSGVPVQSWSVDEARRARPVENQPLVEGDADGEGGADAITPATADDSMPVSRILAEPLPTDPGAATAAAAADAAAASPPPAANDGGGLPVSRIFEPGATPDGFGSVVVQELPPVAAPEAAQDDD